jgi:LacI family transcriptional regulator
MPATIKDVAQIAGVSVATVSRVLNRLDVVAEDTRKRVSEAASKLGYIPHGGARSLSMRQTQCVGAVLPDLHGEFFSELIRGIDRVARQRGQHLLLTPSHDDADELADALRSMQGRADGVLLMSPHLDAEVLRRNLPRGMPAVLMNTPRQGPDYSSLTVDNHGGASAMVRHLRAKGHRRIAMISGPHGNFDADERLRGYLDTLAKLAPRTQPQVLRGDFTEESGHRAAQEIAAMRERPDAVFAANDTMAIGCLFGLAEAGLAVPRDIAVAGFDDIPMARYVNPPLTTVRMEIAQLGEAAFGRLMRAIERRDQDKPSRQTLRTELVVRKSCSSYPHPNNTRGKKA